MSNLHIVYSFLERNLIPTFSHIVLNRQRRVNPIDAPNSSNYLEVARTVTNRK